MDLARDVGIPAVALVSILALVGYLGRRAVDAYFETRRADLDAQRQHELAEFRVRLEAAGQRELTRMRAQLESEARVRSIRFEHINERRLQVIAEVFNNLAELGVAVQETASPLQNVFVPEPSASPIPEPSKLRDATLKHESAQLERVGTTFNKFVKHYRVHRVFLPGDTCGQVDRFISSAREALFLLRDATDSLRTESLGERRKERKAAWKTVTEHLRPLASKIEGDFRRLVGASDHPTA